jgi:hypothetical protein
VRSRRLQLTLCASVTLWLSVLFSVARTPVDARDGASLRLDSRTTHPLHPSESPSGSATPSRQQSSCLAPDAYLALSNSPAMIRC